jgi:hypothetical protein
MYRLASVQQAETATAEKTALVGVAGKAALSAYSLR